MTPELAEYLTQSYRRDVMGDPMKIAAPQYSPELVAEIETEIARIDELRLGAHLASRDFASYQHRRALMRLKLMFKFKGEEDAAAALREPASAQGEHAHPDGGDRPEPPRPESEPSHSDSAGDPAPG